MKHFILFSLSIFLLGSCQSDSELHGYKNPYKDLSPEEYLNNYTTPEVMFHYTAKEVDGSFVEGLLIDNKGNLYKYQTESMGIDIEKFTVPVSTLVMLLTHSEKLNDVVDLEELVNHYKMTRKVDLSLQDPLSSTNQNEDFYFIGYDVTHDSEGNVTCSAPGISGDVYIQKTFKSSHSINKSNYASIIVKWMATVLDKSDV